MAAGLGFIEFTTGDVLSAAAANGYLASQTVMVFADAAARTSAIASPQEGMFSFLKDTNATQFYDGAAWVNLDTTGMVNPMTTTGDVIYSSSGTTPARLGIGTAGQVLTVNSGATAPEWATSAAGGLSLINTTSFSAVASQSINDVFSATYDHYMIKLENLGSTNIAVLFRLRVSATDETTNYLANNVLITAGGNTISSATGNGTGQTAFYPMFMSSTKNLSTIQISNPFDATPTQSTWHSLSGDGGGKFNLWGAGQNTNSTSYTGFSLITNTGTMTGSVSIYGYSK